MKQNPQNKRSFLHSLVALPIAAAAGAMTASEKAGAASSELDRELLKRLAAAQKTTDARQQITDVLNRYARGWDRRDRDMIQSCFFPDSTHQHGGYEGLSHAFTDIALKATEQVKKMSHMITNVMIDIVGDKAVSECQFLAYHRRPVKESPGEDMDWFLKGRYIDKFENREGVWKIAHRRGLHDFSRSFIPADTSYDEKPADQMSQRGANDPLYAMLAELHAGN